MALFYLSPLKDLTIVTSVLRASSHGIQLFVVRRYPRLFRHRLMDEEGGREGGRAGEGDGCNHGYKTRRKRKEDLGYRCALLLK